MTNEEDETSPHASTVLPLVPVLPKVRSYYYSSRVLRSSTAGHSHRPPIFALLGLLDRGRRRPEERTNLPVLLQRRSQTPAISLFLIISDCLK